MATVTAHYASTALIGCERQGYETNGLLLQAGLSREQVHELGSRVQATQLANLIQSIWKLMGDEFMGFTENACKFGSFAMMCDLISRCDTVDAMFLKGIRFYELVTEDIRMEYRLTDKHREFVVEMAKPELDTKHFYQEFWMVIWHRFVSWIVGTQIKLQSVHFEYPEPAHSEEFKYQFACPCYFNEPETKLCFGKQYASLPPIKTQREIAVFLKKAPLGYMTLQGEDNSIGFKIKALLATEIEKHQQFPTFEELALRLHLTPQTARRKLKEEGTSYQKIKDATRCDIAVEKLKIQQMSVNDVAEILGFSEPRSFTRAFKHWTGMTPSRYCNKVSSQSPID